MPRPMEPEIGDQAAINYSPSYLFWRGISDSAIGVLGAGTAELGVIQIIVADHVLRGSALIAGGALVSAYFLPSGLGHSARYYEMDLGEEPGDQAYDLPLDA